MEPGEILRLVIYHIISGSGLAELVFHYILDEGGPDDDEILDAFEDWVVNQWGAEWDDTATVDAEIVQFACDVVDVEGLVQRNIGARTVSVQGTVTGEAGPAGAAGFMYAPTTRPKTRGRKFVPGMALSGYTNGFFNGTYLANLLVMLALYLDTVVTAGNARFNPGVRSVPKEELGDPQFLEFGEAGVATDNPAYQRRRRPGTGI